jgi:hypothetical protein
MMIENFNALGLAVREGPERWPYTLTGDEPNGAMSRGRGQILNQDLLLGNPDSPAPVQNNSAIAAALGQSTCSKFVSSV